MTLTAAIMMMGNGKGSGNRIRGRGGAGLKYSKHLAILANELFMRNRKRSSVAEASS